LVLDNVSIHKSNKVKETLDISHPRKNTFSISSTISPCLNLIEVRCLYWMHRQAAINNSIFLNKQDIGKAVSDWTYNNNKKHVGKASTISSHKGISNILHKC
jgi:hypothetical protein